jgi:hypothetical protein
MLYCTTCHTHWPEECLTEYAPCPFRGCDGTLSAEPPRRVVRPHGRRISAGYPLLDLAERENTGLVETEAVGRLVYVDAFAA